MFPNSLCFGFSRPAFGLFVATFSPFFCSSVLRFFGGFVCVFVSDVLLWFGFGLANLSFYFSCITGFAGPGFSSVLLVLLFVFWPYPHALLLACQVSECTVSSVD